MTPTTIPLDLGTCDYNLPGCTRVAQGVTADDHRGCRTVSCPSCALSIGAVLTRPATVQA